MNQVNIKKCKGYNNWNVEFKGITLGQILAMRHALDIYREHSQVANDVYLILHHSMQKNAVNENTKI